MVVVFLISDLTWSFGAVCVCCEFCQSVTDAYDDINDIFVQFKWYSFPTETWKILIYIYANTQKPTQVQCFGSIICDRVAFKNVGIISKKMHCLSF